MSKTSTPPMIKHADHEVEVRINSSGPHVAHYHCIPCNKFISWISRTELELLQGIENGTKQD